MILKSLKPTTSSQRHLLLLKKDHLAKTPLLKSKLEKINNLSERNNQGRITIRHKGGGHKKRYRKITFNRSFKSIGIVVTVEYDPNRNCHIASLFDFRKNVFYYLLAPQNIKIGDIIRSGHKAKPSLGNALPISSIPVGNFLHNISQIPQKDAQISRAAGSFSQLEEKTLTHARLKLTSGKIKYISIENYATIGVVSNKFSFLTCKGKAGRSR
jgi:large subunit ribosomal protein L2